MTRARSGGFTLIEFMIAITLSLLVLAALTAAFVASSRSRAEVEKANEQIENGRFALQILTDDLETAGFYSHLNLDLALTADTPLRVPADQAVPNPSPWAGKPNPCTGAATAAELALLRGALPMHIQGYDSLAALDADLDDCLADFKAGTDIIVVRRTAICVAGAANCAITAGAPYFQASLCSGPNELASLNAPSYFRLDTNLGNLNRTQRDCATPAQRRQYLTHIYFIANNDQAGDGVPTLKRAELGNAADPDGFTIVPLAHGIQDLRFEYGVDSNGDGAPDAFTTSPDIFNAANCAGTAAQKALCIGNWRNVMTVRLHLLARNSSASRDHRDTKIYTLGLNDNGTVRCTLDNVPAGGDGTCEAFNDGFKRHVYQTTVRLNNPAGRRER